MTDDSDDADRLSEMGFLVHKTMFGRKSPGWRAEIGNLIRIGRIIQQSKPDIVHNIALKSTVFGSLATRLVSNAEIINAITGLGISFALRPNAPSLKRSALIRLMRLALRSRRCHTIVQNHDDLSFLTGKGIIRQETAHVILGSGVDPMEYVTDVTRPIARKTRVVLAARLLWSKGVREFVEAADQLAMDYPDVDFLLAGKVDTANPDHVPRSILDAFSKKPNVTWIGFIDDMVSFLSDSAIVVLPSYREGVPKVLIEAAMIGRPIVTTDAPGCREAVIDGETGLLVPVNDGMALAQAIRTLLEDEAMRTRYGRAARAFARDKFSLDAVLAETQRVYDRVISSNS